MRILARKSLAVLLSFAVIVSMLPGLTLTAHAEAYSWQGDGSKNSPYLVSDAADLLEMQTSGDTYAGKYFKVTENITVTDENFTGIGQSSSLKQFKGNFDGGDKTITLGIEVGKNDVGLFGYLGSGAVVENVTVAGSVTGNYNVGGIAGYNNGGTIRNCTSEAVIMSSNASSGTVGVGGIAGNMTGGTIEKCTNKGDLIAGFTSTTGVSTTSFGGIVGAIQSTKGNVVSECRNEGNIDSHAIDEDGNGVPDTDEAGNLKTEAGIPSTAGVAGIAGKINIVTSVEDCSNSGNVCATGVATPTANGTGGVVGYLSAADSSVERCSNTGNITGRSARGAYTGGIVGNAAAKVTVSQSFNRGKVTAADGYVAGITGNVGTGNTVIQSCYNGGNVSNTKTGSVTSSYNAAGAAGIAGQLGSSTVFVKNSYSYGNVSNIATGSYAYAGGIIGKTYSTSINSAYINDNTYLTDTAAKGIGNVTNDAEGYEASEKADILGVAGSDYQADLTDNINGGFPILRWQNADALYSLTFNVTDKEMPKSLTDAAVTVKNSDAVQTPQADGSYELAPGTYSYEVSRPGYAAEKGDITLKKSSKTAAVALTSVKHDYVVKVAPADADLTVENENAPKIGEPEKTVSEEDNTATYTYSLADEQAYGAYSYSLSRYGYGRTSGELKATGTDDETSVTMTKAATHKFTVKVTPENAKVTLVNTEYDVTVEADSAEGGVWTYSLIPGAYTYKVKASGYTTVADSVTIEESDSNKSVELEEKACWDGTSIDTDWYDDKDTSFNISEPEELAGLAQLVNGGKTFEGKTVNLTKDIDLGSKHWTSIGNNKSIFKGTFNGNGHAVKNLYINITGTAGAANGYRGLFGQTDSAAISSLKLDNVLIEAKTTTSYQYVGSLVGKATKTDISDITVSGKIDLSKKPGSYTGGVTGQIAGGSMIDCINNAEISSGYQVAGITGTTGSNPTVIKRCINNGAITGIYTGTTQSYAVAGIVGNLGAAKDEVLYCINNGDISGADPSIAGIAGHTTKAVKIINSYNTGAVKSTNAKSYVGGIIAYIDNSYTSNTPTIQNCYNIGELAIDAEATTKAIGGVVGKQTSSTINNAYFTNNYYKANDSYKGTRYTDSFDAEGAFEAFDDTFGADTLGSAYGADVKDGESYKYNGGYPILRWQNPESLYDISFVPKYDNKYNLAENSSIEVLVKNSAGEDIKVTGETAQLKNGEYTYTVKQKGYKDVTGSLTVDRESFEQEVSFEAIKYAYTFVIEEGSDLDLVMITEDGEENIKIDRPEYADGKYTYELYNGTYEYTANKMGKGSESGQITVSYEGGEKEITLKAKAYATVTFTVTAPAGSNFKDKDPVVSIYNNDENDYYEGDLLGEYDSESDISKGLSFPVGNYTYKIKADGFATVTGNFEVAEDKDVEITKELEIKTGWGGAEDVDTDWYTNYPDASEYTIANEAQLAGLARLVNGGETFEKKTVKLARDMNLADNTWTPIGGFDQMGGKKPFSGTFDGQGHSIVIRSGNFAKSETSFGVFGYLSDATIRDLIVQGNARVDYTDEEARFIMAQVGAVSGYALNSTLENCSNQMTFDVSITNEAGTASVNIGGLVGWSVGTSYSKCNNIAAVTGSVKGVGTVICQAGGIAGFNNSGTTGAKSVTSNCYNTGEINATASSGSNETCYSGGLFGNLSAAYLSMTNCYNAADAKAAGKTLKAGALAGNATNTTGANASFFNNYYLDNGLAEPTPDSEKRTDAQMRLIDFVRELGADAYSLNDNGGYPILEWESSVNHIKVTTNPEKLVYNDLEDFDDAGMKITAYMGSDDTDGKEIVSGWTVLNGKSLKAGQKTVKIEYKGAKVDVPITVNQIVHTIDAGELVFEITAPKAGETPQAALESGSDKFSAAISWTRGGKAFTGDFEEGAYYRAEVTLTSVYEAGNIYWAFDKNSVPAVDSAYELKNIKFTDSVEDENNANNVMTFTVTFKATSSASGLTDKVSHLYYEGDDSTFVKFGEYLDNTLAIEGGIEKTYTVRELEQLALDSKIGMEGEFGEYSLAGIRLYDLLLENGLSQNTADDIAVYIYGKDRNPVETTIGALRSATGKNAAVIAYGDVANGMPLGSAHGPLWAVQKDAAGIWCANVSRIVIGKITEADRYNVTFTTDPEGADIIVKDAYGNEVASSGNNVYSLRNGEKYSYTVSKEGYSVQSGEITLDGADQTIEVSLRTVWDGKTLKKPAQDEYGFWLIGTAEELMWWNQHYGEEDVSSNVRLTADITLNNGKDYTNEWKVLGTNSGYSSGGTPAFSGTFDGDGHVIRGLYVNRENTIEYWLFWDGSVGMLADRISELGMFGYTGGDAVIQNLGVEGIIEVFDRPDSMYADWIQIGGIAGLAQGNTKIKNCYTNVGIKAVASTETGLTGGYPHSGWGKACDIYAGGIAGSLSGTATVENCYSKGTIIGAETRQVTAGGIVGGLRAEGTSIENCYSTMSIQSSPLENPNWDSYVGGIAGNASYGDTLGHGSVKGTVALNRNINGNNTEDITAARVAGKGDTDRLTGNLGLSSMMIDGVNVDNTDILNGKLIKHNEAELAETYTDCGWSEDVWTLGGYPMLKWQKTPAGEDITVDYGGQEQEDNTDWDGYFGESAPPPYFNVYFKVDGYDSVLAKSFTKEQMMQMAASDNEGTLYYSAIGYGYAGRAVKEYVYLDTLFKNADVTFASGDWLEYGSYYTGKNDMYTYDSLMADRYYYPEWTGGSSENAEKIKPAIALKSYGASSGVTKELWNYYALQADYLYAYMLVFGQKTPEDMTYTYFTYQQVEGTVTYDDEAAANTTVKNWLTSVISQAQADYDATYESADGTDVPGGYKYVSPEQKEKYKAEIAKAADALKDAEATNGSLMSAGNALEKTMKAFDKIKKDGLGKNRTKLESAIKLAESIIGKTVASEDGSGINEDQLWAPQAEIDKLNNVITEAKGVLNDTDASQTEINEAAFKLTSAVEDFSANKGKLEDAAREEAENMLRDYVGSYIDRSKYRDKELAEIDRILEEGIKKINEAKTVNNIKFALDDTLEAIKSVKKELEAEKAEAKEALSDYFYSIVDGYDASQQVVLREALTQGCEKIDKAVTVEDVKGLVASGKAAMDKVEKKASQGGGALTPGQQPAQQPTEAEKMLETAQKNALDTLQSWYEKNSQYYEQQQAELAAAVLEGVKAIREATDVSAVTKALNSAVDKIRLIKTKEQIDSENAKAEELIKQAKAEAVKMTKALKVTTKSTKTAKGNIKVIAKANVSELKAAGFTVKYKFYRSTKKTSGYKLKKTTAKNTYINTSAKKGKKYYYKAKLAVYYNEELIAQTTLKQSTRTARRK